MNLLEDKSCRTRLSTNTQICYLQKQIFSKQSDFLKVEYVVRESNIKDYKSIKRVETS